MTKIILIFIPLALFDANPNKVQQLTEHLWAGGQTTVANEGWKEVEKIGDPTKVGMIYDVTEQQLRLNLDATEIARLKAILDGTGVDYARVDDWRDELTRRGWILTSEKGGFE